MPDTPEATESVALPWIIEYDELVVEHTKYAITFAGRGDCIAWRAREVLATGTLLDCINACQADADKAKQEQRT